jgi:hypothetical protein
MIDINQLVIDECSDNPEGVEMWPREMLHGRMIDTEKVDVLFGYIEAYVEVHGLKVIELQFGDDVPQWCNTLVHRLGERFSQKECRIHIGAWDNRDFKSLLKWRKMGADRRYQKAKVK